MTRRAPRSPMWALALPVLGMTAGLLRWLMQGSGNLYTDAGKRLYVPDPDLRWRVVEHGPLWLGLDAVAATLVVAGGVAVAAFLVRRRESRRGGSMPAARVAIWSCAGLPLLLPAWAFAGGLGPDGARGVLPGDAILAPPDRIRAHMTGVPAGLYTVVAHTGSAITARVSAGGETFDARLTGGIAGHWRGDPSHLGAAMELEVQVDAASVDTGIGMRTESARDYLQAGRHPTISFRLSRLTGTRRDPNGEIAFAADGTLDFVGRTHPVRVVGAARALDAAARGRLGLAQPAAMVVTASFPLLITDTALADDAGDFDRNVISINVSLVLVLDEGR